MSNVAVDKPTSIRVSHATAKRIADYGKKNESYDDILVRILDALPKRFK